jgi:AsmA family
MMRAATIAIGVGLLAAAELAAPYISASPYGNRLRISLEHALGRTVEIRGPVRFSLFPGPGFSVGDVVIHEDPTIGFEPMAYMENIKVRPSLWPLLRGRFEIASIHLEDATLNLTKANDLWNFTSFMNRSVMSTAPAIHVRNGRINFKFGDTKSIFYLMDTDLDIAPPSSLGGGWSISCKAQAARTDKAALGLGAFSLKGKWYLAPERVDLELRLERTQIEDFAVLMSGRAGGIHGALSSRLHLAGPLNGIGILGRLTIEDVHRWDLLPPKGQGWPMDIRGRLDLIAQQLELQSTSSVVPVTTRFRASDYLSRPHWAVTFTWNRLPFAPVLQLARDMGAQLPPKLHVNGAIDGAIGYSGPGGWQGELALHDTNVAIPDSPPLRFAQMRVMVDHAHVRLAPALVRTPQEDELTLEANYSMAEDALDLLITTEAMQVQSLRAQLALAALPWLEQVTAGTWKGQLHYHRAPAVARWTGNIELLDAAIAVPGLADPLEIASARVGLDGARVGMDRLMAKVGRINLSGAYRYEPGTARPHRLRLRISQADAADLEFELMPTLSRSSSLLARALGRATIPDWLRQRKLEGSVQIEDLGMAGTHLENVRARLVWNVTHVDFLALAAKVDGAVLDGALAVTLGPQRPAYKLMGKLKGLNWPAGKLEAEGILETSGTGPQVLARLRLRDLSLRSTDEIYTGSGATQEDGRLLLVLTNGTKEMRMSGTLAALRVDGDAATKAAP